jgi:hypothetical protein
MHNLLADHINLRSELTPTHAEDILLCELTLTEQISVSSHNSVKNQNSAKCENNTYVGSRTFCTIKILKIGYFCLFRHNFSQL